MPLYVIKTNKHVMNSYKQLVPTDSLLDEEDLFRRTKK